MRNRWLAKTPYGEFPFYAETLEIAQKFVPEATELTPYTDMTYLKYIDRIKSKSELVKYDYKGREVYKFFHNDSYILVKLSKDVDGDYYDFCEFQRWDCRGHMNPITWTMSNPTLFCDMFDYDSVVKLPQGYVVTPKEIKKLKATKFYNKNGETYWIDYNGYFYVADKHDMPNKRNKAEYDMFKGNENAVLVWHDIRTAQNPHENGTYRWYESEQTFMDYYNEAIKETPEYCTPPRYEIKKRGYKKVAPDERKVILRLPYINLDAEISMRVPDSDIVRSWSNMCDKSWQDHNLMIDNFLMGVIKAYKEYLGK